MKWLKITICIISILIISLVAVIMLLLKKDNTLDYLTERRSDNKENTPIENASIEKVKHREDYYTVKYILDTYFDYVNNINISAEDLTLTNLSTQGETARTGIERIKYILDEDYLTEEPTNEQIRKIASNDKMKSFRIDSLYQQEKTLTKVIYFANITLDNQKETKIIIKVDSISDCFSILPEEYISSHRYTEENLGEIEVKEIEPNRYNHYEYITVTDEMMAQTYLEDYGTIIIQDKEKSYDMLEKQYQQEKFPTIESYQTYLATNQKNYEELKLKEYYTIQNGDYITYTCKDQYENKYVFKETAVLEYTVQLDDYTLENEAFESSYKEANNRDKGILNIDKFFSMLNMADYKSAYQVLDANFKQNNFKTQTDFETYMKNKIFRYNQVSYQTYNDQITGIYTYKILLSDATGKNQNQIEFNIVMKLLEDTNFVMSFTI